MMAAATVAAFWLFHVSEARSALRSIYSLLSFHLTKTIGLDEDFSCRNPSCSRSLGAFRHHLESSEVGVRR